MKNRIAVTALALTFGGVVWMVSRDVATRPVANVVQADQGSPPEPVESDSEPRWWTGLVGAGSVYLYWLLSDLIGALKVKWSHPPPPGNSQGGRTSNRDGPDPTASD